MAKWIEYIKEDPQIRLFVRVGYVFICIGVVTTPFFTNMPWWVVGIIIGILTLGTAATLWWQMDLSNKLEPLAMNARMTWDASERIKKQNEQIKRKKKN